MQDNNTAVQVAKEKHQKRQIIIDQLQSLRDAEKGWEKAQRVDSVVIGWQTQYVDKVSVTESAFGPIKAISLFYIREGIKELETELINL